MFMGTDQYVCKNCGYSSSRKFNDDICPVCCLTDWKCAFCSYTFTCEAPGDVCPECGKVYRFENITSYIPDWGIQDPLNLPA